MGAKGMMIALAVACLVLGLLRTDRALPGIGAQKIEMSFWNGFTGPDGREMLKLVRQFNDANPDVHVTMQRIEWGTYVNKLMVSSLDGHGPEVFVLQSRTMSRMQRAGFVDCVNDMVDPTLRADILPKMWQVVNYPENGQEKLLGVPLDIWPMGLYMNQEMFKKAGIVDENGNAKPPRTREEFLAVAEKLTIESSKSEEDKQWGFGLGAWDNNFMLLVPQFGGHFVDENGEPTLDAPGNIEALQFLCDLIQKYKVAPRPEGIGGWVGFRQKRVAMEFDGIYMVGDLKRLEGHPYMGAPIPRIGQQEGTLADSHVLCIRSGLDAKKRDAAARFVRFISDHSLPWADAGQVPARISVRNSPGFQALQVQSAFAKQLDYVMYPPRTPSFMELQNNLNLAIEQAIRGRKSSADALHEANADYKKYLERDRMERELVETTGGH